MDKEKQLYHLYQEVVHYSQLTKTMITFKCYFSDIFVRTLSKSMSRGWLITLPACQVVWFQYQRMFSKANRVGVTNPEDLDQKSSLGIMKPKQQIMGLITLVKENNCNTGFHSLPKYSHYLRIGMTCSPIVASLFQLSFFFFLQIDFTFCKEQRLGLVLYFFSMHKTIPFDLLYLPARIIRPIAIHTFSSSSLCMKSQIPSRIDNHSLGIVQ